MTFRKIALTFLIITLGVACAYAKKEPKYEQAHQLTPSRPRWLKGHWPREGADQEHPAAHAAGGDLHPEHQARREALQVPVDDQYMLSRVDFGKGFFDKTYDPGRPAKASKASSRVACAMTGLSKALGLEKFTYNPNGFMQMMFLDPTGFDKQHYVFSYVRREFLGSVRTWVFDVHPKVAGHGPLLRPHLD
jgi:hypothetical protein